METQPAAQAVPPSEPTEGDSAGTSDQAGSNATVGRKRKQRLQQPTSDNDESSSSSAAAVALSGGEGAPTESPVLPSMIETNNQGSSDAVATSDMTTAVNVEVGGNNVAASFISTATEPQPTSITVVLNNPTNCIKRFIELKNEVSSGQES